MPEDYTRQDVEWYAHRPSQSPRNRGGLPRNATINQRITIVSSFYNYAATYTVPGQDGKPTPLLQRPSPTIGIKMTRPDRAYRALSYEELKRFFAVIPKDTIRGLRDRALFLTYFWTARRRSEIMRLRWGDIERSTIVDQDGTRREGWLYHFYGKGHSTEEDVAELPGPAKAAIDEYLIASGRMATMMPDSPIFLTRRKTAMGSSHIAATLKFYAEQAGLDVERVSVHSLRHTSARERYHSGSDIREIQKLLRHQSLATTDVYLRSLTGTADEGARRLEGRLGAF